MPDMFALCQQIGVMSAKLDKIDTLEKTISDFIKNNNSKITELERRVGALETELAELRGKTGS